MNREDIYSQISQKIMADLEQGVRPWMKPWNNEHLLGKVSRPLRSNFEPYTGINVISLWIEAVSRGYSAPIWMTFRQAKALGGHVRKGEMGSNVVYAHHFKKSEQDKTTGEEIEKKVSFMKNYSVFNVEQIEGLPSLYYAHSESPRLTQGQRDERLDQYFSRCGTIICIGGDRAYYSARTDHIQMPPFESFQDVHHYYATLAHETLHWTGHPNRLNRGFGRTRWGDEGYAMEELVAELGSAFLCADLSITPELLPDHASYIASWIQMIRDDRRAIVKAASFAQRAVDYLHQMQPEPKPAMKIDPLHGPSQEHSGLQGPSI